MHPMESFNLGVARHLPGELIKLTVNLRIPSTRWSVVFQVSVSKCQRLDTHPAIFIQLNLFNFPCSGKNYFHETRMPALSSIVTNCLWPWQHFRFCITTIIASFILFWCADPISLTCLLFFNVWGRCPSLNRFLHTFSFQSPSSHVKHT